MKLALLGADADSLELARAAVSAGHEIAWQGDLALGRVADPPWLAGSDAGTQWEDLFDESTAEAILVGRGAASGDLRARQVQELARLGRPMLISHPLLSDVLAFFEIDMARGEGGAIVRHYNPLVESPSLNQAVDWVQGGHPHLGVVEQIVCSRSMADRSRESVERHFARDVDLLGKFLGRIDSIGAHAAAGLSAAYAALSVQLLGERKIPARWTVEPPTGPAEMRLVFICQCGRVSFTFDAHDRATELIEQADGEEARTPLPAIDPAGLAIAQFVAAVEAGAEGTVASTWLAALHAMELTDSIEISLRRGRMIDVHAQQLTEHLAFKGTMAALGCGVLILLVPLLLVVGWIAGQFGIPIANYWPHALLFLLAAFLSLQLLPKLLYPRPPDTPPAAKP